MTPKFIQIAAVGAPSGSFLFASVEVHLFGLTADGEVYRWGGHEWEEIRNHEDMDAPPRRPSKGITG